MLQQTQVATVLPYFQAFMEKFPDVRSLAAASTEEVVAAWSGLGYYSRARALHAAARQIVEDRGARFPETLAEWLVLPGVGRYTAGAVLSIAFGKRLPILDGNVSRVLTRLFLVRGDPRQAAVRGQLWSLAEQVLPRRSVADFNQALMELGALVCTARNPACLVCPLAEICRARQAGLQQQLPEVAPRRASVAMTLTAAVIRRRGRLLMYRRAESLMRDLWELPGGACREGEPPAAALAREARERYGLSLWTGSEVAEVRHHIMNRKIRLHAFEARLLEPLPPPAAERAWVDPKEVARYPMSSMTRKVLRRLSVL
jgi:A/G-specific adenine glycosylase